MKILRGNFWIKALASAGGLGYSPLVPGTVGSLGGVVIYLLFWHFRVGWLPWLLLLIAFTLVSIYVADKAEKLFCTKDPRTIVIDEVAGMSVTLYCVPFSWVRVGLGFFLFRLLDVLKPPAARRCELLPGGWGIVLDDIVSGAYAALLLWTIILLTQS